MQSTLGSPSDDAKSVGRPSTDPGSSLSPSDKSTVLTAVVALRALDLDEDEAIPWMRSLLRRLQSISNMNDHSDDKDGPQSVEKDVLGEDDDIRGLAESMATDRFLSHESSRIQLLTACCLAEILRISAPEPPIAGRKLDEVCALFIDQLCVLVSLNDDMDAFRFSLLEQLATVKVFVIFSDQKQVVCDLFACFYAIARQHQSTKIRQYFADILTSLLEEMDKVDRDVLDALLAPLVPALEYSPSATVIAEKVVLQSAKFIQVPLCNLLNESIRALRLDKQHLSLSKKDSHRRKSPAKRVLKERASDFANNLSEHHEYICDLIIAISCIAPDVLIYVLPNLDPRVRSSDLSVRLGALDLLSRLFTTRADMPASYPALFMEFLNRCADADVHVRELVVSALGELMLMHPKHVGELDSMLFDRVHDLDENVRIAAVRSIAKAVDVVSDNTLNRLITRLQDKSEVVGIEAFGQIVLLCTTVFKAIRNESSPPLESEDILRSEQDSQSQVEPKSDKEAIILSNADRSERLERRMLRLSKLPNTLLDAYLILRRTGHSSRVNDIERGIFEKICFPTTKVDDDAVIRRGLRKVVLFLSFLSESAFVYFCTVVTEKANARSLLLKIADLRLTGRVSSAKDKPQSSNEIEPDDKRLTRAHRKDSAQMSRGNIEEARETAERLASYFSRTSTVSSEFSEYCRSLATAVDLKIYNRILKALDCKLNLSEANEAAVDVISRLGSKSSTGVFCANYLFPKCRPGLFSSSFFSAMCEFAISIGLENRIEHTNSSESEIGRQNESQRSLPRILVGISRFFKIIGPHYKDSLGAGVHDIIRMIVLPISEHDWSAEVVLCGLKLACSVPETSRERFDLPNVAGVLKRLALAERPRRMLYAGKLAKWAARLVISLNGENYNEIPSHSKFTDLVTSRFDKFDGDLSKLLGPMAAVSQLAKHAPDAFKKVSLKCFDFVRILLNGGWSRAIHKWLSEKDLEQTKLIGKVEAIDSAVEVLLMTLGRGEAETLFCDIRDDARLCVSEVVTKAAKVLVYGLGHVDMSEEYRNVMGTLVKIVGENSGDVFNMCGRLKTETRSTPSKRGANEENESSMGSSENISPLARFEFVMRSAIRLCSGRAILFLARHEKFYRKISPESMVTTMLLAQDENPTVRLCFAKSIRTCVLRKKLPLRWISCLALMAVDPVVENVAQVHSMLVHVFQQRRKVCEKVRRERLMHYTEMLPESTLADLIWVLANLPGVEIEEKAGLPESEKCLELLLDCLLEAREYANVLNEYIETVSIAEDATVPESEQSARSNRLKELSRISSELLRKKMAGRKWELMEHVPQLTLPRDLYRIAPERRAESGETLRPALLDVAKRYDKRRGIASLVPEGTHPKARRRHNDLDVKGSASSHKQQPDSAQSGVTNMVDRRENPPKKTVTTRVNREQKAPSSEVESAASRDETVVDRSDKPNDGEARENDDEHSDEKMDDEVMKDTNMNETQDGKKSKRCSTTASKIRKNRNETKIRHVKKIKQSVGKPGKAVTGEIEVRRSNRKRNK